MKTLLIACGVLAAWAANASAASITLQWDANPEPTVAGYIVYVGTAPGAYSQSFDVGLRTSFVLSTAVAGQPYFFTVAAYQADRAAGPRSSELSATAALPTTVASTSACADPNACYSAHVVTMLPGRATSLSVVADGRIFFIDNGQRVRILDHDSLVPSPALSVSDGSVQLGAVAVDPAFPETRVVFVTEVAARGDGTRELSIARYREVAGRFGQRAEIVSGIPLPATGDAPLAVDAQRRLYLAVPSDPQGRRDPYFGQILRFDVDGAVPAGNPGLSPVFRAGADSPIALVNDQQGQALWLVYSNDRGVPAIMSVVAPQATAASAALAMPDGVYRLSSSPTGAAVGALDRVNVDLPGGVPVSAAITGGNIYVATQSLVAGSSVSTILRIDPLSR